MMIDTAVIPCGGLGTRLHPITRWLPKEMLPVAVLPDNLFHGSNPSTAVLGTYRTTGLATVLLAKIDREDAGSKGATGRAAVRKAPDGTLRVVGVADKGSGRFDTAGEEMAVTPIGRMAFPGTVLAEFEEVGRGLR